MGRILQATATISLAYGAAAFQVPPATTCHRTGKQTTEWVRPIHPPLQAVTDSAILAELDSFWRSSPYTAAALVCGFKASMADIVAQGQEFQKGDNIEGASVAEVHPAKDNDQGFLRNADWKRNSAFIAYGALYQGMTQEFIFNHLYPIWFGAGTDIETVLTKVAFTLAITTTILTLPSLYAIKSFIEGYSLQQAAENYIYDIQNQKLLQKFYLLWGPVLTLTFSVIPEHLRVTFIAVISFFWLIILSTISGNDRAEGDSTTSNVGATSGAYDGR